MLKFPRHLIENIVPTRHLILEVVLWLLDILAIADI